MLRIDGETTIELDGFVMDNGEVLISDSDSIGNWNRTKIHITPSMLRFLVEQSEKTFEEICGITIIPNF